MGVHDGYGDTTSMGIYSYETSEVIKLSIRVILLDGDHIRDPIKAVNDVKRISKKLGARLVSVRQIRGQVFY